MKLLDAIRQILGYTGAADAPPSTVVEAQAAYDPDRNRAVPLAIAAYALIDPTTGEPTGGGGGGGTSPGGTGTQLQYRTGTSFGGIAGSSWDGTTLTLPVNTTSYGGGYWTFRNNRFEMHPVIPICWGVSDSNSTPDVLLWRDAAGVLALRNGGNAQVLRVYNTYTDASNYEAAVFGWGSNILFIGNFADGTGSQRTTEVHGNTVTLAAGAAAKWDLNSSGNLTPRSDNAYDFGSSSKRVKNGYFSGDVTVNQIVYGSTTTEPSNLTPVVWVTAKVGSITFRQPLYADE